MKMSARALTHPLRTTLFDSCPGGVCSIIQAYSDAVAAVLLIHGGLFLVTLLPPLFRWSKRKPDGKKRVLFAALACVSFYFWLCVLIFNSVYCFGFLAHQGPCYRLGLKAESASAASSSPSDATPTVGESGGAPDDENATARLAEAPEPLPTPAAFFFRPQGNVTCVQASPTLRDEAEAELKNLTSINVLIIVLLVVVLLANAKEALNAKALHYKETLCKQDEVQRFLASLCSKPPEVGHFVTCYHLAKGSANAGNSSSNYNNNNNFAAAAAADGVKCHGAAMASSSSPPSSSSAAATGTRKVVAYSAMENFEFQHWRDFSDLRLVEPSAQYPIIEIEIVLNFFPGDHYTADKYKQFVLDLTKNHKDKDDKINLDDYFHIEDHREWTFFIGSPEYISPWWDRGLARVLISCVLLFGWPFRMGYEGQIAKHKVEIKKAVFCENNSAQDEGVSLSATPGSGSNETSGAAAANATAASASETAHAKTAKAPPTVVDKQTATPYYEPPPLHPPPAAAAAAAMPNATTTHHALKNNAAATSSVPLTATAGPLDIELRHQPSHSLHHHHHHEHLVNAVISNPPPPAYSASQSPPMPPQRSVPLTSPRTHLRETTKDIVTAVTHHDINGVSAVNTVALKDIDVQMSALSGYETYV